MPRTLLALLASQAAGQAMPTPHPGAIPNSRITPIQRVVKLLEKMQTGAVEEEKKDKKLYEKMDCWCTTNDKQKSEAVDAAQRKIAQLDTDVQGMAAKIEKLVSEIKDLTADVAENTESLASATAIRDKERARFEGESADLTGAIGQLTNAIGALEKHHPASFMQINSVVEKYAHRYNEKLQDDLLGVLAAFPVDSKFRGNKLALNQGPAYQSYNSRSGEIFGILRQLKESMEGDLDDATKTENRAQNAFLKLKASKESEIASAKQSIADKNAEKSDTQVAKSNAEQDIKDTTASLNADEQFLVDLKEKCSTWDADFEERSKTRAAEIKAISEALKIATSDEARDLFDKTVGVSFLQTSTLVQQARARAASVLRSAALKKGASAALLSLAASARLDAFTKVKEAMDEMVAKLKEQRATEAKRRDFCIKEITDTENDIVDSKNQKSDLEDLIDKLSNEIETLNAELEQLAAEVHETQVSIKKAGEDRKAQNDLFRQTVSDQRATGHILQMVLKKLQGFYNPDALTTPAPAVAPGQALLQQEPPKDFENYEKRGESAGVISLIGEIIKDAETADRDAVRGEQDAQTAYAQFISDSNAAVSKAQQAIVDRQQAKAKAEASNAQAKADLESTEEELAVQEKTEKDLHSECDFLIKNFSIRQAALQEEVDSINQAKAILSGANFE